MLAGSPTTEPALGSVVQSIAKHARGVVEPDSASGRKSDLALIRCVQSGDKAAFDLLVLKYQHRVLRLIARYVTNESDRLDVAQEAFVRAYRAAPSFRGDSQFYTWLYRIVVNTAMNYLHAKARRARYVVALGDREQDALLRALEDVDTPEGIARSDEIYRAIALAVSELPEELRAALLLRETHGMSYEEIAETVQCPVGTVRSRIFRAREAVDRHLEPLLP